MPKLSCVLLVDDDPTNNFLSQRLLKRLDVAQQVLVAENGQQALDLLAAAGTVPTPPFPALILLDVQMPVMNGIEFLHAYQQLPAHQRQATTVVVLTTSSDARDLAQLQALPVTTHLNKPLTLEKLKSVLKLHYEHHPKVGEH